VLHDWTADLLDLVLARACIRCERPGRVLCQPCLQRLRRNATIAPGHGGWPATAAALPYEDVGGPLVLSYKEDGTRALAPMLGILLADAVAAQVIALGRRRCLLVPVPGHRRPERGFDALGGILTWAERDLTRRGIDATTHRPVRTAAAYRPLKQLSRADRQRAIVGAFRIDERRAAWTRASYAPVIVVDDVITTGATIGEVIRTLAAGHVNVAAVAAIASASRDTSAWSPAPARPRTPT
jgi:predicted amidophosphoribosyltransferase